MSVKGILQQIHDEADHIVGMDRLVESMVLVDAREIKRLAKRALKEFDDKKKGSTMNLYQITSPNLGTASFIVRADAPKQASQIARDVIEENRMTNDESYIVQVTELCPPENNEAGYCYPINNTKTYIYKQ
jgi:hypothetical protein